MVNVESSDEFLGENEELDDLNFFLENQGGINDFFVDIEDNTMWDISDIPIEDHVENLMEILENGISDSNDNIELKIGVSMFVKNFEKVDAVYDLRKAIKEFNQIVDVFDYDESEVKRIKLHDMINNGNRDRFKLMMFAFMFLFLSSIKQQESISSILGNDVDDEIYIY